MTLPRNYAEWLECITVGCGITPTPIYIERRIAELRDKDAAETKRFTVLYGEAHLQRVLTWFERAGRETLVEVVDIQ